MKWCEHLKDSRACNDDSKYFSIGELALCRIDYCNFCPICGTSRPTEDCNNYFDITPGKAIYVIFKDNKTFCSECNLEIFNEFGCRQKEESLEEKFKEHWAKDGRLVNGVLIRDLAEIAKQHFKSKV